MKNLTIKHLILFLTMTAICSSCCHKASSNKDAETSIESKCVSIGNNQINTSFKVKNHISVNLKEFAAHYAKYPDRWDLAFDFLSNLSLDSVSMGRKDLSEDVFVVISSYHPKELKDAMYESHQKYIDIQYVARGSELIGWTRNQNLEVLKAYDEKDDIAFYPFYSEGELLKANTDCYFIFFPDDIHQPGVTDGISEEVLKVVVKVKVD